MKHKIKNLGMLVLFMVIMVVSAVNSNKAFASAKQLGYWGHRIFDSNGRWVACELGGNECFFSIEDSE